MSPLFWEHFDCDAPSSTPTSTPTHHAGPMWVRIRGQGLAYSFSLSPKVEHGLLYFSLSSAEDIVKAYVSAKVSVSLLSFFLLI